MSSLTVDPRKREIFMGLMTKAGEPDISYEEVRFQDYLRAYQTTGRPPPPSPSQPANPEERKALGLPPLFAPHIEIIATNGSGSNFGPVPAPPAPIRPPILPLFKSPSPVSVIADPNALPDVHVFQPTTMKIDSSTGSEPVLSQCIVLQPMYSNFSFEELRCLAYRAGKKEAPGVVASSSSQALVPVVPAPPALLVSPPSLTPSLSISQHTSLTNGNESFQNISTMPPFMKHSQEELRIAYMKTGRELTSEEIIAQNAVLKMF